MNYSDTSGFGSVSEQTPRGFGHGQLCADHDRLGLKLQHVHAAVREDDLETAKATLQRFTGALENHLRLEETVLFPQFQQSGLMHESTIIGELLREHGELRRLSESVLSRLQRGESAEEGLGKLTALLNAHESKEELFLYPTLFHLADPGFVTELFHRVYGRLVPGDREPR